MPRKQSPALTVLAIKSLEGGPTRREVPDGKTPGLYLVVQPGPDGKKGWAVRYRADGIPRKVTIGTYPAVDLIGARAQALEILAKVAKGGDPAAAKVSKRKSAVAAEKENRDLIDTLIPSFVEGYARKHTTKSSAEQTERLLQKEVLPQLKGRRVGEIQKRDILAIINAIVHRGHGVQANRVFSAMRRMFSWFVEQDILEKSPCAGLKAPTAEKGRDRILTDIELRYVWRAADKLGWPFGQYIKILVLTGQRRQEVAAMRWSELELDKALWTLPRERSKNDTANDVALCKAAIDVLSEMPKVAGRRGAIYVFSTNGDNAVSGFARAKERLDKIILDLMIEDAAEAGRGAETVKPLSHWQIHDLRRTFASGAARLGIQLPVIEKILNHISGTFGGVQGIYQRHSFAEEKRLALETWGRSVGDLTSENSSATVIPLRRGDRS